MKQRNRFVDIAKGISIVLVLFNHYEWSKTSVFNTHLYYWLVCMAVPVFMLCTGYVTAASFESKSVSLKRAYSKKSLLPKLRRYIMPVVWFYLVETLLTFVFIKTGFMDYLGTLDFAFRDGYSNKMTLVGTIVFFFAGGRGQHGTYYFPIIVQVAFMIPLIYSVVKRWRWGIIACFGVNLALEILKNAVNLSYGAYRLLAFRYIFALALGCYLYVYREKLGSRYKWLLSFLLGAGYVYLINYTDYHRVVFTYWHRTSMLAMLFITPVFLLGLEKLKNVRCKPLEELGKASYHILLTQIIYYNFFAPLVWTAPKSIVPNDYVGMLVSLAVCLGFGYGYYRLYNLAAEKMCKKKT